MSDKQYIKWDDSRVEHKEPDEDDLIHQVEKQINTSQSGVKAACSHAYSGTHVKTQGQCSAQRQEPIAGKGR